VSSTDDLEDYDAELELQLKREYATVFSLFRFCVITSEATYLCNQLEMDCAPQAGYLLFEISMEDVWVWDRNRPTRIIPKAQVYTTSDVTVEQLKEDGEADLAAAIPPSAIEQLRASAGLEVVLEDGEDEVEPEPVEEIRSRDLPDAGASGDSPSGSAPSF
jgi:hypothetical protein